MACLIQKVLWVGGVHLIMLELEDWSMPWEGQNRSMFSCISEYLFDYLILGGKYFLLSKFHA
ncbi:hypothetical protein BI364_04375 [Acidihalobacter yilgarnensis]|uniref:Uncharacterized protein n=1 Tax=Acidihalobacter yilgarnensis TaxID=2819280 RepID=A0A1D8ILL4_9GAMM|nr:hypothetical protein BI364_04375 [Acidihalobacter yilgarnensis]